MVYLCALPPGADKKKPTDPWWGSPGLYRRKSLPISRSAWPGPEDLIMTLCKDASYVRPSLGVFPLCTGAQLSALPPLAAMLLIEEEENVMTRKNYEQM